MRYRKLRIAWSVGWTAVAVLPVVLWVWIYHSGFVHIYERNHLAYTLALYPRCCVVLETDGRAAWAAGIDASIPGKHVAEIRYPLIIGLAVSLATAAWFPWPNRYTLRTLLIATTLVAVVLGLAAWAAK